jgi:ankyrin repeat protein
MGQTSLHEAVLHGHVEAVQILVDNRANPCLANAHRKTPLKLAFEGGRSNIVSMFDKAKVYASQIRAQRSARKTELGG